MPTFTHVDDEGRVRMVDVSEKAATVREAAAQGIITMQPETFDLARRTNMIPNVAKVEDAVDPRRQGRGCS